MILTCPECATRYEIDSAKFPAAGRKVRCKKCGHVWFQAGEGGAVEHQHEAAPIVTAAVVEDAAPPATVFTSGPEPDAEGDASSTRAYRGTVSADESYAPQTVVGKKPQRKAGGGIGMVLGWIALIGVVLVIGWSATSYRQQIATIWPQSASLFAHIGMGVNTRGLDFADVQHKNQIEDGQPVLLITGRLVNVSPRQMKVPPLHVTLSDAAKHAIKDWNFSASTDVLAPGQSAAFHTRLSNPPSAARRVDIHFADAGE